MMTDINFEANNLHFTITQYIAGDFGWTAYEDVLRWWEVDKNGWFDTAAEAQQDALAYASRHGDQYSPEPYETRADLRSELSPRVL